MANCRQLTISSSIWVGRAEDVGIVLSETADAQQTVQDAGALVAVDGAELAQAHGQIAVAMQLIAIDQDVAGTVHGLELVFGVVQLHGLEHVLAEKIGVAGGLPQVVRA